MQRQLIIATILLSVTSVQGRALTPSREEIHAKITLLNLSAGVCAEKVRLNALADQLENSVSPTDIGGVESCKNSALDRLEKTKDDFKKLFSQDPEKLSRVRDWYGNYSSLLGTLWLSKTASESVLGRLIEENSKLEAALEF